MDTLSTISMELAEAVVKLEDPLQDLGASDEADHEDQDQQILVDNAPEDDPVIPDSADLLEYLAADPGGVPLPYHADLHRQISGPDLLDTHLSYRMDEELEVKGRASFDHLSRWWRRIVTTPALQHFRDYVLQTPFASLIDVVYPRAERQLQRALGERWWPTTRTFHFSGLELGITPFDFSVITGMAFQGASLSYAQVTTTRAAVLALLPHIPTVYDSDWYDGNMIKTAAFRTYESAMTEWATDPEDSVYDLLPGGRDFSEFVLAFLLAWVGGGFFSTQRAVVPFALAEVLSTLDRMKTYDWACAIYTHFLQSLDEFATFGRRSIALSGYYPLLQVWFWDYSRRCYHLVPSRTTYPRITAYFVVGLETSLRSHISLPDARYQMELMTVRNVELRPWRMIIQLHRQSLQHALQLSRCRVCFVPLRRTKAVPEIVYLGERHYTQLTGRIAIPTDPPGTPLDSQALTFRHHFQQHASWLRGDAFVTVVMDQDYHFWWRHHTRGQLSVGDIYRQGNMEYIAPSAARRDILLVAPGPAEFTTGTQPVGYVRAETFEQWPPVLTYQPTTVDETGSQTSEPLPRDWELFPIEQLDSHFAARTEDDVRRTLGFSLQYMHASHAVYLQRSERLYAWGREGHDRATYLQGRLERLQTQLGELDLGEGENNTSHQRQRRRTDVLQGED